MCIRDSYRPPPEATPKPAELDWTPGPAPEERVAPLEPPKPEPPRPVERPSEPSRPVEPARPAASEGPGWSIVGEQKATAGEAPVKGKKKDKAATQVGDWQLASGEAPGMESAEDVSKVPTGTIVAVAQYAILVVGLVMVLIGVVVMVANSHVT